MSAPLVFLDTETTGVHPGRQVWEVGMIRRDDTGQRETQFFIGVDLKRADPFGLKIGGFYDRHPYGQYLSGQRTKRPTWDGDDEAAVGGDYLTVYKAAELVAQWTHGAHIIGAVPNFDTEVLSKMLRYAELFPAWHYHLIDVEALTIGYLAGQRAAGLQLRDEARDLALPWKSDDLTAALGLDPVPEDERHTALGDARWAMRIYDAVTGDVS
jgi:hypothetical protein